MQGTGIGHHYRAETATLTVVEGYRTTRRVDYILATPDGPDLGRPLILTYTLIDGLRLVTDWAYWMSNDRTKPPTL